MVASRSMGAAEPPARAANLIHGDHPLHREEEGEVAEMEEEYLLPGDAILAPQQLQMLSSADGEGGAPRIHLWSA